MSTLAPEHRLLTHADYFALEQAEDARYEYWRGEVFAMAGGSESHALIGMSTGAALVNALRDRPCRVYGADMKLYLPTLDKFCYPDVMVLCEAGRRREQYVEDPTLVVEVLSETTESYDRGLKFEHYRTLASLRHYLLLTQDRAHAELYARGPEGVWYLSEATGLEAEVRLSAWEVALPLAEVCRNVDFPPEEEGE
jgi:Uma2 family endonuclease